MGPFAQGIKRLHELCANTFAEDGLGTFHTPGQSPVEDLPLIVDRNLDYAGPEGSFMSDLVGITFNTADLRTATRGDIFVIAGERFVVEKLLSDNGYVITAATMVQK